MGVRVVHVRRRRCLVVQRFDRSRSKPNNVRALRCPRLSAMDVEHFDLESDPAPEKRRTSCLITCCREGACSVIGSLQMTVARASTTRLWVTSFEFVVIGAAGRALSQMEYEPSTYVLGAGMPGVVRYACA